MASVVARRAAVLATLVVAAIGGAVWIGTEGSGGYRALDRDLAEPPQRTSSQQVPAVPPSQVAVKVTLPFERLAAEADAAAPERYLGSGHGPDACASIGLRVCVGTQYDFIATRGPVRFAQGPGNTIRVSVPLHVTGHGGFRGSGAHLLDLDAKPFEASIDAFADVMLGLEPDWCPRTQVQVGFSNLDARVEIASGAWIRVGDLIEGTLRKEVQKLGERAARVLTCDNVRRAAQDAWETRSFPLQLPGDPTPLHVNVEPLSIGFSGVKILPSAVTFLLSLGVQASVSDQAIALERRPLPPWKPVALQSGRLQLAIPLRISYQSLAAHLQGAFAGKQFSLPDGVTVVMDKATVYPAGERIAVGAHVKMSLPGHFLSTRGWLYLTARPVVSADGKAVHLADITYSRVLDGSLARVLTPFLDGEIRQRLAATGEIDLTDRIAKVKELLQAGLAQHSGPMSIDLGAADLRLGRIVPGRDALFVEGLFSSAADAVLTGRR